MLSRFTIKYRLLTNSAVLLGLFVLALAVHQFALRQVEGTFLQMRENQRHYMEKVWQIKLAVQTARQAALEFTQRHELLQADQVEQSLSEMQRLAQDIQRYAEDSRFQIFIAEAEAISEASTGYARTFRRVTEAQTQRGLTHDSGLIGQLRSLGHELFDHRTAEHAVGPVINGLVNVQAILQSRGSTLQTPPAQALETALAIFAKRFTESVLHTEKNQELYRLFEGYQRGIKEHLPSGGQPMDWQRASEASKELSLPLFFALQKIYVPDITALVLDIRRYEKDYLARGDQSSIDNLYLALDNVRTAFARSEVAEADILAANDILDEYKKTFDALLALDRALVDLDDRLQAESRHVERSVDEILAAALKNAEQSENTARRIARLASISSIVICLAAMAIGLWLSFSVNNSISLPLQAMLAAVTRITEGDYGVRIQESARDEFGRLGRMFNRMATAIASSQWLAAGRTQLAEQLREDKAEESLSRDVITFLARYVNAQAGAIHVAQNNGALRLAASYSLSPLASLPASVEPGEGLVGEAAMGRRLLVVDKLPAGYLRLRSGLGEAAPVSLLLLPVIWLNKVRGVVELAGLTPFTDEQQEFLEEVAEGIAIALYACRQRQETLALLTETQRQAAVLQSQQEELRAANEELEEQAQALRRNEEELKSQQEELQSANEELEEKSEALLRQKNDLAEKNQDLEEAWTDIDAQARELAAASRYKSEFLANMSHELRTPLNSLLLLARNLAQNKGGNLESAQVESATIIYNSGQDLLRLINDILDLSKIEAGRMDIVNESISLQSLGDWLRSDFAPLLADKGLMMSVELSSDLAATIYSDRMRLEQILRNLVGNAIKFTEQGGVTVRFLRPAPETRLTRSELDVKQTLAIEVMDTGIGITPEQQAIIFDAFKQAEGGTARRYGGTGLGLSISKKLADLMGGEIQLQSQPGHGTTFTLYLPLRREIAPAAGDKATPAAAPPMPAALTLSPPGPPVIPDDREQLASGDKCLLIIEDDLTFAKVVLGQGRQKGFKGLVAATGVEGLRLAKAYQPSAIVLDIRLPDIDGWQVLESLKNDPGLRHIPVHMMSGQEKTMEAFKKGAIGFVSKPVSEEAMLLAFSRLEEAIAKRVRDLLVVEDDKIICQGIVELIGNGDVVVTSVATGREALEALHAKKYDCMILDIGLPDMSGFTLLDTLSQEAAVDIPPVIIYTGRELTREEGLTLAKYTDTVIIKGVKSEERLLDETALFLHRVVSKLPVEKRKMIASLYDQDAMFRDKRVMVVDDDMRNAFALSRILEERGMKIILANDGRHAIELLAKEPAVDLILMDIMMPVMDGYQTMTKIRAQECFWDLPIIALTAKALPEDKERCMAAGANDYLAKPVNEDRLLAMMRVWLYR